MTRRTFVRSSATGIAALSGLSLLPSCGEEAAGPAGSTSALPMRMLGKTGLVVSALAFGGGSQFLEVKTESEWRAMLETAVDSGINYFDTADTYGGGESERRYGAILPQFRSRIYVETKLRTRVPAQVRPNVEQSLLRLRMDYVDVLLIHGVEEEDTYGTIADGIYPEIARLKQDGLVRFIGLSVMTAAALGKQLIDNLDFDVAFLAMNPTQYGLTQTVTLPAAGSRGLGVLAMKVLRNIVGEYATARELLHYALDMPGVASVVVGHRSLSQLTENIGIVREHASLPAGQSLSHRMLERRLRPCAGPHILSWARPDYVDC